MQFKFESKLKLGDVDVSLQNLKAEKVEVYDFRGNEDNCAHCLRPIKEGDTVLVIHDTQIKHDTIVLGSELQLVHIGGVYGSACAEDFLHRIINKYIPPAPAEIIPNVEESTKEGTQTA